MPRRPCLGCGALTARTDSRCPSCASTRGKARDAARGSRQARGYTAQHDAMRRQWLPRVDAGMVDCHAVHCLEDTRRIQAGSAWDMGHTADRLGWTGPEHARCNRAQAGRASQGSNTE